MTLLDQGLRQRLNRFTVDQLWDVAGALAVDPERLPHAERARSDERLAALLRRAIRTDLRAETAASTASTTSEPREEEE